MAKKIAPNLAVVVEHAMTHHPHSGIYLQRELRALLAVARAARRAYPRGHATCTNPDCACGYWPTLASALARLARVSRSSRGSR